MLIEVAYDGEHNFDWDSSLEELAGKCREDSSMNFSTMRRTLSFDFDSDELGDQFVAKVHNVYPDFGTSKI